MIYNDLSVVNVTNDLQQLQYRFNEEKVSNPLPFFPHDQLTTHFLFASWYSFSLTLQFHVW